MTTEQILRAAIRSRRAPTVVICAAKGCYATRPDKGLLWIGWGLVSVAGERFHFCPQCTPHSLLDLKRCIDRCQWLDSAKDN